MQNIWQKIKEEYQRGELNVNSLKTEYLNVGRGIQNIKLERNTEIQSSRPYRY
jgi:hypothetical protein